MLCPRCKVEMKSKMRFSEERNYRYEECPVCYLCTSPKRLHLEENENEEREETVQNGE